MAQRKEPPERDGSLAVRVGSAVALHRPPLPPSAGEETEGTDAEQDEGGRFGDRLAQHEGREAAGGKSNCVGNRIDGAGKGVPVRAVPVLDVKARQRSASDQLRVEESVTVASPVNDPSKARVHT